MGAVAAALAERQKAMNDQLDFGIGSLVRGPEGTLEAKIRLALAKARPDSELEQHYSDTEDRRRVRGRELISLALRAVIDDTEGKLRTNQNGSAEVLLTEDGMSDLATALREFDHDRTRIDVGAKPELVLRPVARESVDLARGIPAGRVLLIHWLVAIHLWNKQTDLQLRSGKNSTLDQHHVQNSDFTKTALTTSPSWQETTLTEIHHSGSSFRAL
jgi:hypothetical protein